jgi:hypothetical protein
MQDSRRARGARSVGLACLFACWAAVATAAAAPSGDTTPLSAADWREDLAFAREEMPKRHPNLFHSLSRATYETEFDRLLAEVDQLPPHVTVVRLAEIVASIGEGHSRLTLPVDPAARQFDGHTGTDAPRVPLFHQYPLRLTRSTDGYVVTRTSEEQRALLGARLVSVDGHTVEDIEIRLTPAVHRDNDYQRRDRLPQFMVIPEVMQATGVVATVDASTWRVEAPDGSQQLARIEPVPLGQSVRWRALEPPPSQFSRPALPDGRRLWFTNLEEPSAVYVRIAEIDDEREQSFAAFAGGLQRALATTPKRRLIIDLRGNPGGDNSLNPAFVRALIRTPWVSEPGALYVMADSGTFSAAMNLCEDLERWLPAVFVGDGTGGRPNSYGDARKLVLPRSGLTIRLSSLYWQNHPRDERPAILPLIEALPSQADLLAGRDPAIALLSDLDTAAGSAAGDWQGSLSVPFQQVPMSLSIPADGGEAGRAAIPALGVESAALHTLDRAGDEWHGDLMLAKRTAPLAARVSGRLLVGWVDYRGNRYPFVLTRK